MAEHWASASNYEAFHHQLKEFLAKNKETEEFKQLCSSSFRITVESFNKKIEHKTKIDKIETLDYLPFNGEVKLQDAEFEYFYIEFNGLDSMKVPPQPEQIYFGRWVSVTINLFDAKLSQFTNKSHINQVGRWSTGNSF